LFDLLTGDSSLDTRDHPTLGSSEVNIATYAGKSNLMLVREVKELLQLNRAPMKSVEIPYDDRLHKSIREVIEETSVGRAGSAAARRHVAINVNACDRPPSLSHEGTTVLFLASHSQGCPRI
jgi:hypothetical protein